MGGERRRKRVVQLEEIRCVEASKTERIVINKAHPLDGCTGEKMVGGESPGRHQLNRERITRKGSYISPFDLRWRGDKAVVMGSASPFRLNQNKGGFEGRCSMRGLVPSFDDC